MQPSSYLEQNKPGEMKQRQENLIRMIRFEDRSKKFRERRQQNETYISLPLEMGLSNSADSSSQAITQKVLEDLMNIEVSISSIEDYFKLIAEQNAVKICSGLIFLRKLLSNQDKFIFQMTIEHPVINTILWLASQEEKPYLKMEALWILANILTGTTSQIEFLFHKDVLSILFKSLKSKFQKVIENALWAIGNICTDNYEFRGKVLEMDLSFECMLVKILQEGSFDLKELAVWIIASICRLRPNKEPIDRTAPYIRGLIDALSSKDGEKLEFSSDCVLGLQNSVKGPVISLFNRNEIFPRIKTLYKFALIEPGLDLLSPIHAMIGGLTSGPDELVEKILQQNFLTEFSKLLMTSKSKIHKKEVCWILTNIALAKRSLKQAIISETGLLDYLFDLSCDSDPQLANEAIWVICSLCKDQSKDILFVLIDKGLIQLFVSSLRGGDTSRKMLVLEGLGELLINGNSTKEEGKNSFLDVFQDSGIYELIDLCRSHEQKEIYQLAQTLYESYHP